MLPFTEAVSYVVVLAAWLFGFTWMWCRDKRGGR
jgi:hypothetical protein